MCGKRLCCCILMMLSAMTCVLPVRAAETDRELIRLAIPVPSGTVETEISEGYIEYTLEYLHEISQYTGWDYEVIQVPGTYETGQQTALNMLRDGTADLVAPIAWSERMEEDIRVSQNSYATGTAVLQVPNEVYQGEALGTEVRVAALKGGGMEAGANLFFERHGIRASYVQCQSIREQIEMVTSGKADVMLNSNFEDLTTTSIVAEFAPQGFHFAATDQALLQELDSAMLYIKQANPFFSMELYQNTIRGISQDLTLEEKDFIEQSEPYVVAIMDRNAPYQYISPETGQISGIAVSVLKHIAEQTGLQFEFLLVESWDELLTRMQEGTVHIAAVMPYDYEFAAQRDLTITGNYSSSPYVLLAPKGYEGPYSGQRLALLEVNSYSGRAYVGDVVPYANVEDCVEAVRQGEADYTYVDLYTAQYYLEDARYRGMELIPQSYAPRAVCFGLAKPTPHELISILNKSINQLSAADLQNMVTQNVNPARSITIVDVIMDDPLQSLAVIGGISVVIAGLLTFLLWRKERISRVLRRKAMEDGLTHLYNAAACRKLISQKLRQMKAGQMGAFLIMDVDHFKEINDNHGHHTGDWSLQRFAALLRDALRGDSVVARIGGDEFVVYLDSIKSEENISAICERIRSQAHAIRVGDRELTVSIGAMVVREKDSYDVLYRLADKALYEAKHAQRDRFCLARREE